MLRKFREYRKSENYLRNNVIFMLGILSAAVYSLSSQTLILWLSDLNVPTKVLGFISVAYIIHALKIFWIPIFEKFDIPILRNFLDRRASWIFLFIFLSGLIIFIVSFLNPINNIFLFATLIGFCTLLMSVMDTLLRAQIIKLSTNDQDQTTIVGLGGFGFKVGMYVCVNVYYFLSLCFPWIYIYRFSGIFISLGAFLLILLPKVEELSKTKSFKELLLVPYKSFIEKHKNHLMHVIGFMVFFRLQDRLLAPVVYKFILTMKPASSMPFLSSMNIKHIYSFTKFINGPLMAFSLYYSIKFLKKHSYRANAIVSVIVHSASCLPFLFLNMQKTHMPLLIISSLLIEKIGRSFSSNVYYMYQSKFCEKEHATGQVAMLTFLESIAGAILGISSGFIVLYLNWTALFVLGALVSLPVLYFIRGLPKD